MSVTTSFHGAQEAFAARLDSGTVYIEIRDGQRNCINLFVDKPMADLLATAADVATALLGEDQK